MTVHVSRRTPPAADAAKAAKIAQQGGSLLLTGDTRHLRKVRDLLTAGGDLTVFLGTDDQGVWLSVTGPGEVRVVRVPSGRDVSVVVSAGWGMDHVG